MEMNYKKVFLQTLIGSLVLSALVASLMFMFSSFGEFEVKCIATTVIFGVMSLTGLLSAALFEKRKDLILGQVGIVLSLLTFVYTLLMIWVDMTTVTFLDTRMMFILGALAGGAAHASLMLLIEPRTSLVKLSLIGTLFAISLVTMLVVVMQVFDYSLFFQSDALFRALAVFVIFDALGTIITPVLQKVSTIE